MKNKSFEFEPLKELRFSGENKFNLTNEDIDNLFEHKKGAYTFLVLSLLYPNIKYSQVHFHQDHIHPSASFGAKNKNQLNIADDIWDIWKENKDKLANLQLLEGRENLSKGATLFDTWFSNNIESQGSDFAKKYKADNYLLGVSFLLKDFGEFYKSRRELLKQALQKILL